MKNTIVLSASLFLLSCSTLGGLSERQIASTRSTEFDEELRKLGYNIYFANLHAHHFMSYGPPTKKELAAGETQISDFSSSGVCPKKHAFPQDDGRPCRNSALGINSMVPVPPDASLTTYLKQACDYAHERGELDIMFVTPHTKNNQVGTGGQAAADTVLSELEARHKMLADINAGYRGTFYCGLGQEASSISAGNHMGIFGQFKETATETKPFFFRSGSFDKLYPQVKERALAGENIILQFNHPDFRRDSWSGDISSHDGSKDFFKKHLRDYGLDDYPPMKCVIEGGGCPVDEGRTVTESNVRRTYANIREAAGDRFRLIEMVPTAGATNTTDASFKPVRRRASAYSFQIPDTIADSGEEESDGPPNSNDPFKVGLDHLLYDYIYYLNMGFKLGPAANQDNHHMNWGTAIAPRTGLVATSLAEDEILTAMDKRRTFATEDKNAKVLFSLQSGAAHHLMGSELTTSEATSTLRVGYYDPDLADAEALVRVYFYRASEALAFDYKNDPSQSIRLLNLDQHGTATLPSGALTLAQLQEPSLSLPIVSGQLQTIRVPAEIGTQYMFIEITQKKDFDKIWTAPIWVTRLATRGH